MKDQLLLLPDDDDYLIRRVELPNYIPVSTQTLARWAHEGIGPKYTKLGKTATYRVGDIRKWLNSKMGNK